MIHGVGSDGLAQAAIEAAMRRVAQSSAAIDERVASELDGAATPSSATQASSFTDALARGLDGVDRAVKQADSLPIDMLSGKVADFHEIAGQLKQAELALKFSLEVRNKLIDAYRETMRMSV